MHPDIYALADRYLDILSVNERVLRGLYQWFQMHRVACESEGARLRLAYTGLKEKIEAD